ncbi:MAG: minor capsid protein [Eggerthellaceae bacterium]|jgi:hypothetical protein|nr:minor capsid protein [Eggerthellaceae bacterium]MCH4220485.1 minor capsid protein [Eggerthellaceae bacterium]
MIDLLENVKDRVRGFGYKDAYLKRFDSFTGREAICISPEQASLIQVYMDGRRELMQPYQIIVRRRSQQEAKQIVCDIATKLEHEVFPSHNGSYEFDGGYVYTDPSELELEETGFYAYVVVMAAQITTN